MKTGYYLELLTSKMMKLFWGAKTKITKNENEKTFLLLEITKVVSVLCNTVKTIFLSMLQGFCICLFIVNLLVNY